jgi:glutathione synthase/RimK-type ligase-like ATP-grasp enzyme
LSDFVLKQSSDTEKSIKWMSHFVVSKPQLLVQFIIEKTVQASREFALGRYKLLRPASERTMTILILGGPDDAHGVHVFNALRQRGADIEYLDSRWFPSRLAITFHAGGDGTLRFPDGRRLAFGDIQSVYWRNYNNVQTPQLPDAEQAYIATNDARGLFESFLIQLPVRWVNGWRAYQLHQTKPVQLAIVSALGVQVPATMMTNDAVTVRQFVGRTPACIFKPVQGGAHTQRVTSEHLTDANLCNLEYAPITLQEEIPGTNIRVFVAGTRVLACEVRTPHLDFRDDENPLIVVHTLPDDIARQSEEIARSLELLWTGMDFRLTPDGRYFFLEANPSPMFMGFESRCGLPLTDALIDLLMT